MTEYYEIYQSMAEKTRKESQTNSSHSWKEIPIFIPPEDEEVIGTDGIVNALGHIYYDPIYQAWVCDNWDSGAILIGITHWMRQPEPPGRKGV